MRILIALLVAVDIPLLAADPPKPVRFMLHGNMSPEPPPETFLRFVEEVQPDIVVMGTFDQRLYSRGAEKSEALLLRWKAITDRLHKRNIRLIGQMEMNVLTDRPLDLKENKGWFEYHDRGWDEQRLGRRPVKTAVELLEEPDLDPRGKPVPVPEGDAVAKCGCRVNTKALRACINKPAWREEQKRMVSAAIAIGVDGFLTNRNYFGHCGCDHCRAGYRRWLGDRHSPDERKKRFGITDLDRHPLTCVVGMHREIDTTPDALVLEKQRFIKHRVKDYFDELYLKHGRSVKKDLLIGQWNHLAFFDELHLDRGHLPISTRTTFAHGAADERWGLPPEIWGKGEDLIWYCNWGTTQNTILDKEYAGDTALYGKYVRALAGNTPYVINKYDFYRPRNMMAEAAALGYATNAIATPVDTEEDRAVVARYFQFLKKHDELYRSAESFAEAGLVFPRHALHVGDGSPLEYVEAAGRTLLRRHTLFDMIPDDLLTRLPLERYRVLLVSGEDYLGKAEMDALARFVEKGGKLIALPVRREDRERPGAASPAARHDRLSLLLPKDTIVVDNARTDRAAIDKALAASPFSTFDAPWSVQVHAYRQPKRLLVHLINYNHKEKATGKSVVEREAPIAAQPVAIALRLPKDCKPVSVSFVSPDDDKTHELRYETNDGVLKFRTPSFLVYGLCVIKE